MQLQRSPAFEMRRAVDHGRLHRRLGRRSGRFPCRYDLGELLSYKGIAEGVENSNFLVHAARGYFILTLYEKRVAASDLPFFLALMEHLARARPHLSAAGRRAVPAALLGIAGGAGPPPS